FVSVHDVARACRLALETPNLPADPMNAVFNIGSGEPYTVREVCERLAALLGSSLKPTIESTYRAGDIRHCYADLGRAATVLGYVPQVSFTAGLTELVGWLEEQRHHHEAEAPDVLERARTELAAKRLVTTAREGGT
ncbi:MAG: NAD-dependent epimerase/dehydratase family protein, partial [Chloroflexota bacterium]